MTAALAGTERDRLNELLVHHRFGDALSVAEQHLLKDPTERDALLCKAAALRFLGRIPEAFAALEILQRHHPRCGRLHEERGRCFVVLRQAPQAIESFLQAVNLNPTLAGSWGMLERLYRMIGDQGNAALAAGQVQTLQSLAPEVLSATSLLADGDVQQAEAVIRAYLQTNMSDIEAMRLLARIGIAHKVYLDAQILLAAVLEQAPDYQAARQDYALVLCELHRYVEARRELDILLQQRPDDPSLRALYATCCAGLGEHERSIELFGKLLSGGPQDAETHLSIGHALKTLGSPEAAISAYHRAADCRPHFGDAWWSLANLKTYRFDAAELERMQSALDSEAGSAADRYHLHFALGKALEDREQYAQAFEHYRQGNALKRPELRYRAELIEENTAQQIRVCSSEFFAQRQGWGDARPDPIFIIGLPRSGSTLLEQILASHSQVEGTQELPHIQQIMARLRGVESSGAPPRYPQVLTELSASQVLELAGEYLEGAQVYRTGKPFFIDKMPNNFRHLGLIHLLLPNARIIDARREPMACCFSNFKQLFANGQEFTYGLTDLARYYRTYLELMRHWHQVLPGRILRVQHEAVVEDLEGSVHRLLEFCGLPFEPQCLAFHENKRVVRTASSEQVRQKITRSGLEQWKHFAPWLDELSATLGDARDRYLES